MATRGFEQQPQLRKQLSAEAGRRNIQIFLAREPVDAVADGLDSSAKRRGFQRRLNAAFNATVSEAPKPLLRSTSAPCRASRQRRPAPPPRLPTSRQRPPTAPGGPGGGRRGRGGGSRRGSPVGVADVETMVSLVSPAGSDGEEVVGSCGGEKGQGVPLAKEEKFVTFQQSSIHSVRSFSASFPCRRTTENHRLLTRKMRSSSQDEKITLEKIRLNPAIIQRQLSTDDTKTSYDTTQGVETVRATSEAIQQTENAEEKKAESVQKKMAGSEESNDAVESKIEDFESFKEKQCWNLYSKITKNGINVSFDTILRGMLTPTEYRTRQRSSNIFPQQ